MSDGLILDVYFPTKPAGFSMATYRYAFSSFVDELIAEVVSCINREGNNRVISWLICGTDTNAHFSGSGSPPRRKDDWAAREVRRFMRKFGLVSLAEELCPNKSTRMNSRGNKSCLDTFLVSKWLFKDGRVLMYDVLDWFETGSDHCPIYLRVRVYPDWCKRLKPQTRRIFKTSGLKKLRNKLENVDTRSSVVSEINLAFSSLNWSEALDREDMDRLWSKWIVAFDDLVNNQVGTRPARESSWGRKFDTNVRALCKKASVSRSWYLFACQASKNCDSFYETWSKDRREFIAAWEKSKNDWFEKMVSLAIKKGDIAIWRLLNRKDKGRFRPLETGDGRILTDPALISKELSDFHQRSRKENTSIPPGDFKPVVWDKNFLMKIGPEGDLVLDISDDLVVANIKKLKLSTVPDSIKPVLVKALFGSKDTVKPLADLIRAVARTRIFPTKGKLARQIFVWKGKGGRDCIDRCRTITMANAILKLCEACVKDAGSIHWQKAGFPCSYWGQFSGAPESIYIWQSTVECYLRRGKRPETTLTDVSKAFDRLCIKLYVRKLVNYGLPRQLIELVVEFITGVWVHLSWGEVMTDVLPRGDSGVPQGSLEGMWNFSVYSDNIQNAIVKSVPGIVVGGQVVRDVVYADDDTPINSCPTMTNLVLDAIASQGSYNCFKFDPSKCSVIGADPEDLIEYKLGDSIIKRSASGILLGAVIDGSGINAVGHVKRRKSMVMNDIYQLKSWRTRGLSSKIVYRKLFKGKILPRFSFAFALLHVPEWGPVLDLIREVFDLALSRSAAFNLRKLDKIYPGLWTAIMGFPPAQCFLRQEKLLMAARLLVGNYKAARIFRGLLKDDPGYFESDVLKAISDWSLENMWKNISIDNIHQFKVKVRRVAKSHWPRGLGKSGHLSWLFHNHRVYSGNVPAWADWIWPQSRALQIFESHFVCLLTGLHPAGGDKAVCCHDRCVNCDCDTVYNHHFFKCHDYLANRIYFKATARRLFSEKDAYFSTSLPISMLEAVLVEPCPMWVGLMDRCLFKPGMKLGVLHELHRIMTMASIFSWGRFYTIPKEPVIS